MSVGHPRVFYKPADIARAQANLKAHTWARRAFAEITAVADPWLARSDSSIRELVPEESPLGERSCCCPVHGGGPAEWVWSLDEPGVLRCGRGGEVYPNADFPDDGSGWLDERPGSASAGKRFFFAGRCRGYLCEKLEEAAGALAVAGAVAHDRRYAAKAAVILERLAEVYPNYPQHDNSDGTLAYGGKLHSNTLVESYAAFRFAKAYDLVMAAGVLSEAGRRRIVDGLLVPLAALLKYSVDNFYRAPEFPQPMNIHAWLAAGMAAIGVAVGRPDLVAFALDSPRGFHAMMDRCVFADGIWFEGAPSYNVFTVEALYQLAEATLGYTDAAHPEPVDLYAHPRFRLMFQGPVAMLMPNGALPPVGDSHAGETLPTWFCEVAYDRYGDPELAELLVASLGSPEARRGEFALFHARPLPAEAGGQGRPLRSSVNLPEVGCAILRTRPDSGDPERQAALYLDYGDFRNEHSHYDLLNLVVFAEGREIVSDFGYIYWDHRLRAAWMQTTPAHNTVIVDGGRQSRAGGRLLAFSPGNEAQVVEVAADHAYPSTRLYRRSLALVQAGDQAYAVDLFRVAGGSRHEWLLHAQSQSLSVTGVALELASGKLGAAPGYDFISLERRGTSGGDGFGQAVFSGEAGAPSLRLHFRKPPGGEVLVGSAEGQRLPVADEGARVPVLVLRNDAGISQFVSVLEPYRQEPFICAVEQVEVGLAAAGGAQPEPPFPAVGLRILLADGTEDLILSQEPGEANPARLTARLAGGGVAWQERLVILRRRAGAVSYLPIG